jgi:alcohol dehydrogenase class IV
MRDLVFRTTPKIISAAGSLTRLPELAAENGCRSALIVADPGIVACGFPDKATKRAMWPGVQWAAIRLVVARTE